MLPDLPPFISPVITYFSSRFTLKTSSILSASLNAALLISLTTLTACGGSNDDDVKDTIAPVIILTGDSALTLSVGTPYAELGATANDATDGSIEVTTSGYVDSTIINSYTLTYSATDTAGNKSSLTRTVNVIDDIAPVITLKGVAVIEHNYGDAYTDLGAMATDNIDGEVAATTTDTINIDMMNSYGITYTATDAAGNTATLERTVNVVDLTAPVITLNGSNIIMLGQGRAYKELGAIALDNVDGELVVDAPTGNLDVDTIGQYLLTYSVTDASSNETALVRTIDVVAPRPFITTWKTTTANENITISLNGDYAYNYSIDWGDGTIEQGTATHDYDDAGTYDVTISGIFPAIDIAENPEKLINIKQWGDIAWQSTRWAFANSTYMSSDATDTPDLRKVTDANHMFHGAVSFNADIGGWDVSSITDMAGMFSYAHMFNQDISAWNVSSVKYMGYMFSEAKTFNQDISTWNVHSAHDMSGMFNGALTFNQDINTWNVHSVKSMSRMFYNAIAFNQDISSWNVHSVTRMGFMFYNAKTFNQDISAWNVHAVEDMSGMLVKTPLSTLNFDALLQAWSLQVVQRNVELDGGDNPYSNNSQDARDTLTGTYGWTIGYGAQ